MRKIMEELEDCPVIAAVKDEKGLEECLNMDVGMVFVLYGTVCTIGEIVKRIKDQGKIAVVHIDLIQGLSGKDAAVEFLKTYTRADGIITTKPALIKCAKELGMFTVLRFFVIDSMAYDNIQKQTAGYRPDVIEILLADAASNRKNKKECKMSGNRWRTHQRKRRYCGCTEGRCRSNFHHRQKCMENVRR